MTTLKTGIKLLCSIAFDIADFFLRIPGFGSFFDFIGGLLSFYFWGKIGALQFLELLDFTDQIDAFFPTVTIAGIIAIVTKKKDK